jgi:hypothetical protein
METASKVLRTLWGVFRALESPKNVLKLQAHAQSEVGLLELLCRILVAFIKNIEMKK